MMTRRGAILRTTVFVLVLSVFLPGGAGMVLADDDAFFVELASDRIDITTGFVGADIRLFGYRKDKDSDVVVVIRGPDRTVTVWRKAKVMGAWINRYSAKYKHMPLYYDYALGRPEDEQADSALFRDKGIGVDSLFAPEKMEAEKDFVEALVAEKRQGKLFPAAPRHVGFLNDNFFRVDFHIPSAAPTGRYRIESFLIKDGKIMDTDMEVLKVEQVGLNALIYRFARDHAISYGLACIFLALGAGWFVSALRVKP